MSDGFIEKNKKEVIPVIAVPMLIIRPPLAAGCPHPERLDRLALPHP